MATATSSPGRHSRPRQLGRALTAGSLALLGVASLAASTTSHGAPQPPLSTSAGVTDARDGGDPREGPPVRSIGPSAAWGTLADLWAATLPAAPTGEPGTAATGGVPAVSSGRSRPAALAASPPVTLLVPAIGVRSALLRLGQAADGSLAVPPPGPTYDQAGWYRYSPMPGSVGPAVIVGHVDSRDSGPSVFYRLGDLRRDDAIRVTRADGSVAVFAVDRVLRFRKSDFPARLVYGNTRGAVLRLVTCGGPFDRRTGHYRDNVVVLATLRTA